MESLRTPDERFEALPDVPTALLLRVRFSAMRFATHDRDLAAAALAEGVAVLGP